MKHIVNLSNLNLRTDLAIESIETENLITKEINDNNIKTNRTYINNEVAKKINKKEGNYTTIIFNDITDIDNKNEVEKVLERELKEIFKINKISRNAEVLIVGLGNELSTPDALGPKVIEKTIITRHIKLYNVLDKNFRCVSGISPSVTGKTGIETIDIIKSVIDKIKPNFIIIIDALASNSLDYVNKTIQITDSGITPGSGVGNNRKELSYETLNIPVIAIGVPTVTSASTIVASTINYLYKYYEFHKEYSKKPISNLTINSNLNYLKNNIEYKKENILGILNNFNDEELKILFDEVLNPIGYNYMVTPKEIDFIIEKFSDIISNALNRVLHKKLQNKKS